MEIQLIYECSTQCFRPNDRMKRILPTIVITVLLATSFSLSAENAIAPLPTCESVLHRVIQQAKNEDDNDRAFDRCYSYTRTKVTELRNSAGQLKKREEKNDAHDPAAVHPATATPTRPKSASIKTGAVSDTQSNVHGQQFARNDFLLNQDLIGRFDFTMAGREWLNGRSTLMVDFVPANRELPERNLKERFINKAAGRLWIDETDYSLVKADLHLTRQVNIGFGLIGAVWKFAYGFERERTGDGLWFTRAVNWHLEGREVIINRIVDYHETMSNVQKIN